MNAPAKIEKAPEPDPKMKLWNEVSKTDPRHTKKVNQRGGFTAISAHYQVMSATAAFGPVGIGWGYVNGAPIWHENLVVVPVTLWHGNRENSFGPIYGAAEWKSGTRVDSDATKKAATDGLTKALSHLGFNADVFLGRFDDNKYVQAVAQEFIEAERAASVADEAPPSKRQKLDGPYTSPSTLSRAAREFVHTLEGLGDIADFDAIMGEKETKEFLVQMERDMPDWWHGGPSVNHLDNFIPLEIRIANKKRELEELETINNRQRVQTPLDAG